MRDDKDNISFHIIFHWGRNNVLISNSGDGVKTLLERLAANIVSTEKPAMFQHSSICNLKETVVA